MNKSIIPEQYIGSQMDVRSEIEVEDIGKAIVFYQMLRKRLLDVNDWEKICGSSITSFHLVSPTGLPVSTLEKGNLIKINIPGPGSCVGGGFDWVCIELILENSITDIDEWSGFTVRPCENPLKPGEGTAHFFSNTATSTFLVGRTGTVLWAEVHGRNETPNTRTEKITDYIRNSLVGFTAKMGFSFPQWKQLTNGLIKLK